MKKIYVYITVFFTITSIAQTTCNRAWGTYLGLSYGCGVIMDNTGNVYKYGGTTAGSFPASYYSSYTTAGAHQPDIINVDNTDAGQISKFSPQGTLFIY
jgi:hypothetical protein